MLLMIAVSSGMMWCLPKMMANMDPEEVRQAQGQLGQLAGTKFMPTLLSSLLCFGFLTLGGAPADPAAPPREPLVQISKWEVVELPKKPKKAEGEKKQKK
jgi:hypothetical protein